jgi:Fe-S-cluster containining protein
LDHAKYRGFTPEELTHVCSHQCEARCCKAPGLILLREREADRLYEIATERGVKLKLERDDAGPFLRYESQENTRCPFLGADNLCTIYDDRPTGCRNHPSVPKQPGCLLAGWEPKPQVCIASIHGRQIPYDFFAAYERVAGDLSRAGMFGGQTSATSCRVDHNRNLCVQDFLAKTKADYLLFIDDDMGFPPDLGERLVAHGKDIVCGLYFQRSNEQCYPHLYEHAEYGTDDFGQKGHLYKPLTEKVYDLLKELPRENIPGTVDGRSDFLLPVDAGGTGCTLIHRRVLEKMPSPWFRSEGATNGDLMFFKKAKDLGFEVWGDVSTICTHYRSVQLGIGDFLRACEGVGSGVAGGSVNSQSYWDQVHAGEGGSLRSYGALDDLIASILPMIYNEAKADGQFLVADFGCGRSTIHARMHEARACRIVGIDFAESAINDNRERFPDDNWLREDVAHTSLADESVDLAFSNSVIEHLSEPKALTDEMWRTLKPGGMMILGIPLDLPHPEHVHVYSLGDAVQVAARYATPVWCYPLEGRAVVCVEKPR